MKKLESKQMFMTEEEVVNALARSKNELPKALASSKETPLVIGNISIDCYVLDDEEGTAVLSKSGLYKALGISKGGDKLEKFVHSKFKDLENGHGSGTICNIDLDNPIKFIYPAVSSSETVCYGYKAGILIDICNNIIWARDNGVNISDTVYINAKSIICAAAKTGITAMIYEATGYERMKKQDMYMRFFNSILFDEARKWEKFFDDNGFLKDLAIMKGVAWAKPGCYPLYFGKLINDLVYSRIAPDMMVELGKRNPKINNYRRYRHHQFFKEGGETLVKKHLDTLHILAKASGYNWNIFMGLVENVLPVQPQTGIDDIPEDFFKSLE